MSTQSDLIDWIETTSKITCSKCGKSQSTSSESDYATEEFRNNGWTIVEKDGGEECLCKSCSKP